MGATPAIKIETSRRSPHAPKRAPAIRLRKNVPVCQARQTLIAGHDGGGLNDLELLRLVAEIAATSSFTQAARRLGIDQSWLSKRIRHFEASLGVQLFRRTTRRVEVTAAGALLLEPAQRFAEVEAEARAIFQDLRGMESGPLRIGALPFSFPDRLRTNLMDHFVTEHPQTRLSVTNGPTPRLLDALSGGEIDIAFVSAPIDTTRYEAILFWRSRYVLLLPEDHCAAHAPNLLEAMAGQPVLIPLADFSPAAYRRYCQPLVDAGLVPVPVPEFQGTASYAEQLRLPAVCTEMEAEAFLAEGFIIRRLELIPDCEKLVVRLINHRTPAQAALWDMARSDVAERGLESLSLEAAVHDFDTWSFLDDH